MSGNLRAFLLLAILGGAGLLLILFVQFRRVADQPMYGMTFSPTYARFLGLDPREVLPAALDEMPFRKIRVPVHWNEVQSQPGVTDFTELDWIMSEAARRNIKVTLAIGNKVPRWPECYTPDWAKQLTAEEYEQALLDYVEIVVTRYRTHAELERWQVENEVLYDFGDCPSVNYPLVQREIAHVRALDDIHPIQVTVSGEQQAWVSVAREADVIGTSMYRQVALPNGWEIIFPIPPRWYTVQTLSVLWFVDKVTISELQAEPWLTRDYREYSYAAAAGLFTPSDLVSNITYAHATGLKEISLWGVEWWYYLKQNGHPELWNAAREYLK